MKLQGVYTNTYQCQNCKHEENIIMAGARNMLIKKSEQNCQKYCPDCGGPLYLTSNKE